MKRRLKPVKDLSVLIVAPRRHDQQLWAELLKNCEIKHPVTTGDIKHAATIVGAGQADVVFVDESYGAQGIANVLIPARSVEFSGGRGVCLILCSKRATAQDVMNARRLGFASLIILPASTGTVQKHLELAARYIPPSDEELGWSTPKPKEEIEKKDMPAPKADPLDNISDGAPGTIGFDFKSDGEETAIHSLNIAKEDFAEPETLSASTSTQSSSHSQQNEDLAAAISRADIPPAHASGKHSKQSSEDLPDMVAPGRSAQSAEEEVVFL